MEAVAPPRPHFHAVEFHRVIGVNIEIQLLQENIRVHAIWRINHAANAGIVLPREPEEACGTVDACQSSASRIYSVCKGRGHEKESEGRSTGAGHFHSARNRRIADDIGIGLASECSELGLQFRDEFLGSILTGRESHLPGLGALAERKDIPAGCYIVEIGGDAAIHEFNAHHVLEGATEVPAEGIRIVVGGQIAIAAIHGDSHGALFLAFIRE